MARIKIDGMTCGHCAATVEKAVRSAAPGATVEINLASGEVQLDGSADEESVKAAIRRAGYKAH